DQASPATSPAQTPRAPVPAIYAADDEEDAPTRLRDASTLHAHLAALKAQSSPSAPPEAPRPAPEDAPPTLAAPPAIAAEEPPPRAAAPIIPFERDSAPGIAAAPIIPFERESAPGHAAAPIIPFEPESVRERHAAPRRLAPELTPELRGAAAHETAAPIERLEPKAKGRSSTPFPVILGLVVAGCAAAFFLLRSTGVFGPSPSNTAPSAAPVG